MIYDVVIIGAGVIGAMLARGLSKYNVSVCVLEKENDVACGASKANSGIIHGGYDPEPGTLKAKLNIEGVDKLFSVARKLNVPFSKNGSLVCAFDKEEYETVKKLYQRGLKNRVKGISILSGDKVRKMEPRLSCEIVGALHVPNAGIICPYELTIAAMGNAMDNGVFLKLNYQVSAIEKQNGAFVISSSDGQSVMAKYLINCAGVFSGRISKMAGGEDIEILPRKGEYMLLDKTEGNTVRHTIFQVPNKDGKGILVTPTADGNLLVGPTAMAAENAQDTKTTAQALATVTSVCRKSVPDIDLKKVITSFSGIRASVKSGDFIITPSNKVENLINVAAIDSPGLTCCVSIAERVTSMLVNMGMNTEKNKTYKPSRGDMHFFRKMSDKQKNKYIKRQPTFGRVVCRCENVTEGEIILAMHTNPCATDLDGVKRRTRSSMGRCQGGFCLSHVMHIMARENNVDMTQITKKGADSFVATDKI